MVFLNPKPMKKAQALAALAGGAEELRHWLRRWDVLLAAHGPYTAAGERPLLHGFLSRV